MTISDEDKRQCCLMLSIGCDRETACNYLGITAEELRRELESDAEFRSRLLRSEATPEFNHMRHLHKAAQDAKNWRISIWWLEHCAPERYGRRAPDSLTMAQLKKFVDELADSIGSEVHDEQDRSRLLAKFEQIAKGVSPEAFHACDESPHVESPRLDIVSEANHDG